ncbi:NAD(P)(+) transhydrogenase (Re/Si-specific) subunit beta [Paraburkholderia flava]|uniref:NAD(P)(+) transhydrogenase (Re/Si-specific) subunit beta n=1 Tax=Paraburkholderia flava TaxID=2547393 RepID=UPI001414D215|nr:NAD(P)(+) transhydrogenase (Re/Si-specific) subunit beta [Paraburkholderia flava]
MIVLSLAMLLAAVSSAAFAAVCAGVARLAMPVDRRRVSRRASSFIAGSAATCAACAVALGAGLDGSPGATIAAMVGAVLGAMYAQRRDFARRPAVLAWRGTFAGCLAIACGFARYGFAAAVNGTQRAEVCVAIFVGAALFASSTIVLCRVRGAPGRQPVMWRGERIVDIAALALCAWLAYGFATASPQTPAGTLLFAMSVLAAALGAHWMALSNRMTTCSLHALAHAQRLRFDWRDVEAHASAGDGSMQPWKLLDDTSGVRHRAIERSALDRRRYACRRAERMK